MTTAAASYDFGVAKFGVMYQDVNLVAGQNPGAGYILTANVPFGATSLGLGYGERANSAVNDVHFGDGVKQTVVGLRHDLSKRTNVQAQYINLNRQGATYDVTRTMFTLGHAF